MFLARFLMTRRKVSYLLRTIFFLLADYWIYKMFRILLASFIFEFSTRESKVYTSTSTRTSVLLGINITVFPALQTIPIAVREEYD